MKIGNRRFNSYQLGMMGGFLVLAAVASSAAVDALDTYGGGTAPARPSEKYEIALQGSLEVERAVQDFKDYILRGDPQYNVEFHKHLEAAENAAELYEAPGPLNAAEQQALASLRDAIPRYRAAIDTVDEMREHNASVSEIDAAVKGGDRPISAAFSALESMEEEHSGSSSLIDLERIPSEALKALAAAVMLLLGCSMLTRRFPFASKDETSLRDLSDCAIRWEEEKRSRAFLLLRDGVCQSLSAAMYMLKSGSRETGGEAGASAHVAHEPVILSLQAAIRETMSIARDLHPQGIDHPGLLGTLDSIWFDNRREVTGIQLDARSCIEEEDIPEALKPTILRLAHLSLEWCAQSQGPLRLSWELTRISREVRLAVAIGPARQASIAARNAMGGTTRPGPLADVASTMRARVVLSGGCCEGARDIGGAREIVASWNV